jgi:hypothetical protein
MACSSNAAAMPGSLSVLSVVRVFWCNMVNPFCGFELRFFSFFLAVLPISVGAFLLLFITILARSNCSYSGRADVRFFAQP